MKSCSSTAISRRRSCRGSRSSGEASLCASCGHRLRALTRATSAVTPRTRVVCASWVFSFFGHAVDIEAIGRVCHESGVLFVVNASQAVGARPLDVAALPADAVVASGFKWLCGPYATGFVWLRDELRTRLDYPQPHWLRLQQKSGLDRAPIYALAPEDAADAFDVFCTANFLSFMPWAAAVEHLLEFGIERIAAYDQELVEQLVSGLPRRYRLLSPRNGPARSTLVYVSHEDAGENARIFAELRALGVDVALRDGRLRLSPHLYNSRLDIDRALDALAQVQ